jgi:3-methyladenine DNA glycosylase AlkD
MDVTAQVEDFAAAFRAAGSGERARADKAYMKTDLDFHGVAAPFIRAAAKGFKRAHPEIERDGLLALVEALWQTSYHDLRSLGIALLEQYVDTLDAGDLNTVESLLERSSTWALVDFLATKVAAPLVAGLPDAKDVLESWSRHESFWVRRACMLALLPELRAGRGDFELFARFAASMVSEKEFFIRKAIGWVLREVSKKRPELSRGFLDRHLGEVSGLTLREGAKYLPGDQREELMERYRARGSDRRRQ